MLKSENGHLLLGQWMLKSCRRFS